VLAPLVDGAAVRTDPLEGVPLAPQEPDPHHGRGEVVGRLQEIAGQHAEAPGVRVELLVEPVLHREVGDGHADGAEARSYRGPESIGPGSALLAIRPSSAS